MSDKLKIRVVVDEDVTIIERLDAMAEAEGVARSDMLRRAIRQLVFSSSGVPSFGKSPEPSDPVTA